MSEIKQHESLVQIDARIAEALSDIEDARDRVTELMRLGEPTPDITDAMKSEIRELIGADFIAQNPQYNPDNLEAYYSNDRPSFRMGGVTFDFYDGPKTWTNAWSKLLEFLGSINQILPRR